jgi:hypothetical protein
LKEIENCQYDEYEIIFGAEVLYYDFSEDRKEFISRKLDENEKGHS